LRARSPQVRANPPKADPFVGSARGLHAGCPAERRRRADRRQEGFRRLPDQGSSSSPEYELHRVLLEQAGAPFGAAEYIGDFTTNAHGNAHNTYRLIVQEAFSSTLVNGVRQRVDLNRIGSWFADPNDDNFCLGPNSPPTPFDGDGQAGVQAFNSANADPLPAP